MMKKHNICMVSDFFYPNMGGVESHIYQLSQCLIQLGHNVIIVTHQYNKRSGVRYLSAGIKVYYLPMVPFYNQCVWPSIVLTLPIIRDICIRENISIIHGHSAFSTLAHETMFHARTLGIPAVFTDHSLFGFSDASSLITNKFLQFSLAGCDHAICVSHISKENTVLRAGIQPQLVSVIPNAIDATVFTPQPAAPDQNKINIVLVSRLVYRKGMDLLAAIIPEICSRHDDINFIIGGDGPKRVVLEEVRERHSLQSRVHLLGSLPHTQVKQVLVQGHIFLNPSLTEAFCIAIVEAASCGLQVVSTNVGGIPEVLPSNLIHLAEPSVSAMVEKLELAISEERAGRGLRLARQRHEVVRSLYSWTDTARRTQHVYNSISSSQPETLVQQLARYYHTGPVCGPVYAFFCLLNHLLLLLLDWISPEQVIDRAPNYSDCIRSCPDSSCSSQPDRSDWSKPSRGKSSDWSKPSRGKSSDWSKPSRGKSSDWSKQSRDKSSDWSKPSRNNSSDWSK